MTDQDDEPQGPHVPVVEAGRRAAQRAVAVGPLGQVLSQEAGRELADRVADAVMAATLPLAEGLRLYEPGADDAGQPVHWNVYNAMHKRVVDAGDKVARVRRLAKRWEVKRLHGDAVAELRDVLGDDGAKAEQADTVSLFTRIHWALTAEHYRRARAKITASPEQHSAAMARVALTTLGLPVPGPESVRTVIQEASRYVVEPAGDLLGTPPTYGLVSARRLTLDEQPGAAYQVLEAATQGQYIVAYTEPGLILTCLNHGWPDRGATPITSEDLADGGICVVCGQDVLAVADGRNPSERDQS